MEKKLLLAGGILSVLLADKNKMKNNRFINLENKENSENINNVDYFNEKTDINHLVLAGGGLAGTQYAYLIKEMEKKYNFKNILEKVDMVSSNSVGSLIAYGYLLEYSSDQVISIIDEIVSKIFKKNIFVLPIEAIIKLTGKFGSFFNSKELKKLLIKYLDNSPLNKKRIESGLDKLTYDSFTLDVLKEIYPKKIFNFLTFNLNKSRIEIFTNSDVYDTIKEDLNLLMFNLKGVNMDIANILKADSTIAYNDCFVKSSVSKVVDIILGSSSVPFFFESVEIESLCEDKLEKNYYADGLISGGNIPVLLGNKLLELIINKKKQNNKNYIINNMIINVNYDVNDKYKPKNGISSLFEFLSLTISSGSGFYTKILSFDQLVERIRFNNRYLGVKFDGFILSNSAFKKNKQKYLNNKESHFSEILDFKFKQKYIDAASFDYFRYLTNDKWIDIFINENFQDEKIKNDNFINKLAENQTSNSQIKDKISEVTSVEDLEVIEIIEKKPIDVIIDPNFDLGLNYNEIPE